MNKELYMVTDGSYSMQIEPDGSLKHCFGIALQIDSRKEALKMARDRAVDRDMILNPSKWPILDALPMTKQVSNIQELGVIINHPVVESADPLNVVWLENMFFLPDTFEELERVVERVVFNSVDELLDAGWEVN